MRVAGVGEANTAITVLFKYIRCKLCVLVFAIVADSLIIFTKIRIF